MIRLVFSVRSRLFLPFLFVCLLLTACQSHRRQEANRAVAMLNVMNQVATVNIEHEKNGDPPPPRFASWPAYWQHHFATLHYTPPRHEKASDPMRNVGNENLAFVKQRRTELGLPPFD